MSKWLSLLKKTLNNAGHIDTKLIDFSEICQKNPTKSAVFYWLFLGEVPPPPRISCKIGRFFLEFARENPLKFDFFLLKSCKIGRFFCEFGLFSCEISWFFREFWLFHCKNPLKSADFSVNLPLKIPQNFAFFLRNIRSPVQRSSKIPNNWRLYCFQNIPHFAD